MRQVRGVNKATTARVMGDPGITEPDPVTTCPDYADSADPRTLLTGLISLSCDGLPGIQ